MKKISGSMWLFIVVVMLSAQTYFFEFYKKDNEEKKKTEASKIFNLQKDQVNEVSLQGPSGKIVLQRTVDGWELAEPVKDVADKIPAATVTKNKFCIRKLWGLKRKYNLTLCYSFACLFINCADDLFLPVIPVLQTD